MPVQRSSHRGVFEKSSRIAKICSGPRATSMACSKRIDMLTSSAESTLVLVVALALGLAARGALQRRQPLEQLGVQVIELLVQVRDLQLRLQIDLVLDVV